MYLWRINVNISSEKRFVTCEIFATFFQLEEGYSKNTTLKKIAEKATKLVLRFFPA
jgi:hypothetical protein